jgi:hypothetical protein
MGGTIRSQQGTLNDCNYSVLKSTIEDSLNIKAGECFI